MGNIDPIPTLTKEQFEYVKRSAQKIAYQLRQAVGVLEAFAGYSFEDIEHVPLDNIIASFRRNTGYGVEDRIKAAESMIDELHSKIAYAHFMNHVLEVYGMHTIEHPFERTLFLKGDGLTLCLHHGMEKMWSMPRKEHSIDRIDTFVRILCGGTLIDHGLNYCTLVEDASEKHCYYCDRKENAL